MPVDDHDYLAREARARVEIDRQLDAAGWAVQQADKVNFSVAAGVAVREFVLEKGHGRVDYLLFIGGQPVGVIEAKPEGTTLTEVERQSGKYVDGLPDWIKPVVYPLPFIYESTGKETRFTNGYDPDARSRRVFTFHRPETLMEWARQIAADPGRPTFRARLRAMPQLDERGLWKVQGKAITNLEESLRNDRPRSLIQMATGSGKTFTAANISYRLIRYADAKRILFLVDRKNLGKQTKQEFDKFEIPETRRKFSAEYNIQHLVSDTVDSTARVCISTVQRIYSILRGEELEEEQDEHSLYELPVAKPVLVEYQEALPPDAFDVIIIDECHRSIYGLWRQVLEYFDAHLIGLTATPTKQTFGFFKQNLVMEYSHEEAVTDNVNVDFTVYMIKTAITSAGSTIEAGEFAGHRRRHPQSPPQRHSPPQRQSPRHRPPPRHHLRLQRIPRLRRRQPRRRRERRRGCPRRVRGPRIRSGPGCSRARRCSSVPGWRWPSSPGSCGPAADTAPGHPPARPRDRPGLGRAHRTTATQDLALTSAAAAAAAVAMPVAVAPSPMPAMPTPAGRISRRRPVPQRPLPS